MKKIQIKLPITAGNEEDLSRYIKKHHPSETSYKIVSRNVDARGAAWGKTPYYVYDVLLGSENILPLDSLVASNKLKKEAPLIIGAGPAGLFCALYLVDHGVPVTLLERGSKASQRMLKISQFWRKGIIDVDDNVCFGEGGAGLFSDGKLITRVKSPYVKYVMQRLVEFGAPKEVEFVADPHVGSNKIRQILTRLTSYLEEKGCHLHFNTRVEEFLLQGNVIEGVRTQKGQTFYSPHVILAVGHSAENMYKELEAKKVLMTAKDFAIGIRIEHPRKVIDALQYGKQATSLCSLLGSARYRLSYEEKKTGRGTYSFCMCPGGYVLSSGTEQEGLVTNGMSNSARNSPWSNSALVVSVKKEQDFFSTETPLAGLNFQREIEKKAYYQSKKALPAMTLEDFLKGELKQKNLPKSSCPSGVAPVDFKYILPRFVITHLQRAIKEFDKNLSGYLHKKALVMAPETRTSAPVTIVRDTETLESVSHKGLYPCGEGAGYAGGITSAAVDGIRVAVSLLTRH